jgi:hypothetical protein
MQQILASYMKKPRLYSRKRVKMPKPPLKTKNDHGFSLRTINEADSRFHVVRLMRERVKNLMDDCDAHSSIGKEWMCGRAAFILGYLETQEIDAIEGTKMDWKTYLAAVRSLTDVLTKLGLDKAVKGAKTLEAYLNDARNSKNGNGKHKVKNA